MGLAKGHTPQEGDREIEGDSLRIWSNVGGPKSFACINPTQTRLLALTAHLRHLPARRLQLRPGHLPQRLAKKQQEKRMVRERESEV